MKLSENQRAYERKAYNADVDFVINNHTYFAELKDISLSGALISMETIPRIEYGDDVSVTIPFASQHREVQLKAQVTRYTEEGLGVVFF